MKIHQIKVKKVSHYLKFLAAEINKNKGTKNKWKKSKPKKNKELTKIYDQINFDIPEIRRGRAIVYGKFNGPSKPIDANLIFQRPLDPNKITSTPLEKPHAGEIFLCYSNKYRLADFKNDKYGCWGKCSGPKGSNGYPGIKVIYYDHPDSLNTQGNLSEYFKKKIYITTDKNNDNQEYYVIHYWGNHELYTPKPHGNAEDSDTEYQRTLDYTIQREKDIISNHREKSTAWILGELTKEITSVEDIDHTNQLPTGKKQIQNIQYAVDRTRKEVSEDGTISYLKSDKLQALFDIIEKIKKKKDNEIVFPLVCCIPDLIVGMFDSTIVEILNKVTTSKKKNATFGTDFTYVSIDATYNIGPYYVTPISFKNIMIKEEPIMLSGIYTY